MPDTASPPSYIICTIARSGSTLLSEGLETTGVAGKPREYFSQPYVHTYEERFRGKFDGPDYFSRVRKAASTSNGVSGVKVLRPMFPFMVECAREHAPASTLAPAALLSSLLPNLHYIWIRRRDVLARAISQEIAQQNGIWHEYGEGPDARANRKPVDLVFNFDRIHAAIQTGYMWDRDWTAFFEQSGITPFVLYYEDFAARYRETLIDVLAFLGLPTDVEIREPRLKKQAGTLSNEWMARFQAIAKERDIEIEEASPTAEATVSAAEPHIAASRQPIRPAAQEATVPPLGRAARRRRDATPLANPPSYLVCAANRSGSTLLCGGLWRTRIAGNPAEYFAVRHAHIHEEKFKEKGIEGPTYFSRVRQLATTPNGVFGTKVQQMQFPFLIKCLEEHTPNTGLTPAALIERSFPNLRYIWLWRRDSLARGISAVKAAETGVWHRPEGADPSDDPPLNPLEFDFQRIMRAAREHNRFDREWMQFFQENSIKPLELVYEDFVDDYEGTLRRVLGFLGLDTDVEIKPPHLAKLADSLTEEWTVRFNAIAKEQGIDIYAGPMDRRPTSRRASGATQHGNATLASLASAPPMAERIPAPVTSTQNVVAPLIGRQKATASSGNGKGMSATLELLREGVLLHQQGRLGEAERVYQQVLQQEPANSEALHRLGLIRIQESKAEEAVDLIERSLDAQPNAPTAYNHLAIAQVALRRYESALANFTRALMLKRDYAEAHNNMGAALKAIGRNEEALVHYTQALVLKPDYLDAHYNYAVVAQLMNKHIEAIAHFTQVVTAAPNHAEAHYHLGISFSALNRREEATEHFQKSMSLRA